MTSGRLPELGRRGEGWVAFQLALLAALVLAPTAGLPPDLSAPAAGLGLVLVALGGLLAVRGVLDLGANLTPFPRPKEEARLVENGVYRLVRHPIYGGLVVAAAGWALLRASPIGLLLAIGLLAFFELKSRREEAWLGERFPGYGEYRRRTRRFFPGLY